MTNMLYNGINLSLLQHACDIIAETENGLSGSQIIKYSNSFAVEYDVKIPYTSTEQLKTVGNKRSVLFSNLKRFNEHQQIKILSFLCDLEYKDKTTILKLRQMLTLRLGDAFGKSVITSELVQETKAELTKFPKALKLFNESLEKYKEGRFSRNLIDDMRLSLELFLKELLGNDKSLENQIILLGSHLKQKGISNEVRNTFMKVIDYYSQYQNHNIKHSDSVKEYEIEYIIEQTSVMIKFLIRIS